MTSNEDRLSNLQPSAIAAILVLLPIRDAVRTSILSRQWRYRWTSTPQIVFNEECSPGPSKGPYLDLLRRVSIVDQVLLRHKGPIRKFQCSEYLQSCPAIHRWITFLSDHPIEEFILQCLNGDHLKVPSNLFSYKDIRFLALTNCIVKPPSAYSGLPELTTLHLLSIITSSAALESLLPTCKSLQELKLIDFHGLTHLKILSPSLKRIYIRGSFQGLLLATPHLTSAEIQLDYRIEKEQEPTRDGHGCNLVEALGHLPCIERLVVDNNFLKFLALGTVPPKLPTTCIHLQYVNLCIDFSSIRQMSAAVCLIASAPCLLDLHIDAFSEAQFDIEGFAWKEFGWEAHNCHLYRLPPTVMQLNCLRLIVMRGITEAENELSFLRFVLANAPVLRTMTTQFAKNVSVEESKIFKKLLQFQRASPLASVEYLEHE